MESASDGIAGRDRQEDQEPEEIASGCIIITRGRRHHENWTAAGDVLNAWHRSWCIR